MTKELPPHSVIRTLNVNDVDAILVNERAGFPPEEQCSKEKMIYRLKVCPELSAGVFIREFESEPEMEEVKTSSEKKKAKKSSKLEASESDEEAGAITDADGEFSTNAMKLPAGKSTMVSEKLIAHLLATKTTSMFIDDESMEIPDVDEYGRRKDPNDPRGHQEDGRTIGIHSLVVDKEYQGQSVGSILMRDYIQRITTQHIADRISLLAHQSLVPFYERFGFVDAGLSEVKFGGGGWHNMYVPLKDDDDDM